MVILWVGSKSRMEGRAVMSALAARVPPDMPAHDLYPSSL